MTMVERKVQLRFLPEHRVLLCVSCRYCILRQALDRHLLVVHRVPLPERQKLIAGLGDLDLARIKDVKYPSPGSAPIPGLPIFNGYTCRATKCPYLCITTKRMQAHWRTVHHQTSKAGPLSASQAGKCKLQTFFQGSNLRYFVVAGQQSTKQPLTRTDSAKASQLALLRDPECFTANETTCEWLLTKQFFNDSYSALLPTISSATSWREHLLRVCVDSSFLRYAMLSVTASHIAFKYPDSRILYGEKADAFRCQAIRTLATCMPPTEVEYHFTLFNFTRLLTISCLAREQLDSIQSEDMAFEAGSVLPEHVKVQHHGRALTWPLRGQGRIVGAMHGPAQRLFEVERMPEKNMALNPHDTVLQRLASDFEALEKIDHLCVVEASCLEALYLLRRIWAIPFANEAAGFRDVALMWSARVPQSYLELVENCDPVALIVLAHWCVLVRSSEDMYWYMKGHAERVLLQIVRCLDWQWQTWITWPMSWIIAASPTSSLSSNHHRYVEAMPMIHSRNQQSSDVVVTGKVTELEEAEKSAMTND